MGSISRLCEKSGKHRIENFFNYPLIQLNSIIVSLIFFITVIHLADANIYLFPSIHHTFSKVYWFHFYLTFSLS